MDESTGETAGLFQRLAAYLAAGPAMAGDGTEVEAILDKLEYLPAVGTPPDVLRHRIALLSTAGRFSRVFQLVAPDAPGVAFFGAEVSAAGVDSIHPHRAHSSASGAGLSILHPFESCIGEGVEYLSQFETAHDRLHQAAESEEQKARASLRQVSMNCERRSWKPDMTACRSKSSSWKWKAKGFVSTSGTHSAMPKPSACIPS